MTSWIDLALDGGGIGPNGFREDWHVLLDPLRRVELFDKELRVGSIHVASVDVWKLHINEISNALSIDIGCNEEPLTEVLHLCHWFNLGNAKVRLVRNQVAVPGRGDRC